MPRKLFILFLLSFYLFGLIAAGSGKGDRDVLLQLKIFLQAENPMHPSGYVSWNESDSSPCQWAGVQCSPDGRVTSLDLSGSYISVATFAGFSQLSELQRLDLSDNTISGNIPADIVLCSHLHYLNLSNNLLSGGLNLSGLTELQVLDVSGNNLNGTIDANFPVICTNLVVLNVSSNSFIGDASNLFERCQSMKFVDISMNHFTGEIWPGITNLTELSVSGNNLGGGVPLDTFQASCHLQFLDLSRNWFGGSFPDSIENCSELRTLSLWGCGFVGQIPRGLGRIPKLEQLILGNNSFDRQIPTELQQCKELKYLDLSNNGFGGEVQQIIGKLMPLQYLVLHSNRYTSGIEASGVIQLPGLIRLDLGTNNFSGNLPAGLGAMPRLRYLMLGSNNFSGEIPPGLADAAGLQALDLSENSLSGKIPAAIGRLKSLLLLIMSGNQLIGPIPAALGKCHSLMWLDLSHNRLSGPIPPELANAGSNPWPTFSANQQDKIFRAGSGECTNMRRWLPERYPPFGYIYSELNPRRCRSIWRHIVDGTGIIPICTSSNSSSLALTQAVPGFVILSGNLLSGEIPATIGRARNISLLLLDDNQLTGTFPAALSRLPLTVLNVSGNALAGAIPEEIGNISCLEFLDLSSNNFSGELPVKTLNRLSKLSEFNVSHNPYLAGHLPTTGQLTTFDQWSFVGDPLISSPELAPNSGNATMPVWRQGMPPRAVFCWAFFSLAVAVLLGTIACLVLRWRNRSQVNPCSSSGELSVDRSKGKVHQNSIPKSLDGIQIEGLRSGKMVFAYADIETATDNFSERRIVGRGGFGVVYHGVLQDGRHVAVKKLFRPPQEAEDDVSGIAGTKELQAEMDVLTGQISVDRPHPNLVALYGWCIAGSATLLVYEYLSGGSLEELIGDWDRFGWEQRLRAAVGIAEGLVVLHHERQPPVVHRDIKASNVLLDGDGNAKVADFGLARVVGLGHSHVSTVVAGTVGYVAPEYASTWRATTKGDVYSYGVLVMELATGRRAVDGGDECLLDWARRTEGDWSDGRAGVVGDEAAALEGMMRLALRCTAEAPQQRPDMPHVLETVKEIAQHYNSANYKTLVVQ